MEETRFTFFPGEANPNTLPAHALGLDVEWSRGHWNVQGEFQKFTMEYNLIPVFHEQAGYGEVKRVLSPRWYVVSRDGYTSTTASGKVATLEVAAAFRANRFQLLKMDYEYAHHTTGTYRNDQTLGFQLVTSFHVAAAGN